MEGISKLPQRSCHNIKFPGSCKGGARSCQLHKPARQRRRLQLRVASPEAPLAASQDTPSHKHANVALRVAQPVDYWPAADLHCRVFQHSQDATSFMHMLQCVDRIIALQVNDGLVQQGSGKGILLVAYEPPYKPPNQPHNHRLPDHFPEPMFFLRHLVAPVVRPGLGVTFEDCNILGVVNLDTFGDLVPPRQADAKRDGAVGWYRRDGYGYVSNMAVSPSARRRGVARLLMAEAERTAAEWGCRAMGLHCNPKNTAAQALYKSLGYKGSVLEPAWMPYVQGRAPDRCRFMLKPLPKRAEVEANPE